jgi:hypothetical protein
VEVNIEKGEESKESEGERKEGEKCTGEGCLLLFHLLRRRGSKESEGIIYH